MAQTLRMSSCCLEYFAKSSPLSVPLFFCSHSGYLPAMSFMGWYSTSLDSSCCIRLSMSDCTSGESWRLCNSSVSFPSIASFTSSGTSSGPAVALVFSPREERVAARSRTLASSPPGCGWASPVVASDISLMRLAMSLASSSGLSFSRSAPSCDSWWGLRPFEALGFPKGSKARPTGTLAEVLVLAAAEVASASLNPSSASSRRPSRSGIASAPDMVQPTEILNCRPCVTRSDRR
mmetsp:Transcript_15505/g.43403  ORF Transcript_15505/g.43403 Transcript_15505/m.43403 type:complete len:235 (-) Transcript_15505:135-839(-)